MKYVALAAINAPVDGQVVRLVVGQEFEAQVAPIDLLRAGYARPAVDYLGTDEGTAAAVRSTAVAPKRKKK